MNSLGEFDALNLIAQRWAMGAEVGIREGEWRMVKKRHQSSSYRSDTWYLGKVGLDE